MYLIVVNFLSLKRKECNLGLGRIEIEWKIYGFDGRYMFLAMGNDLNILGCTVHLQNTTIADWTMMTPYRFRSLTFFAFRFNWWKNRLRDILGMSRAHFVSHNIIVNKIVEQYNSNNKIPYLFILSSLFVFGPIVLILDRFEE